MEQYKPGNLTASGALQPQLVLGWIQNQRTAFPEKFRKREGKNNRKKVSYT